MPDQSRIYQPSTKSFMKNLLFRSVMVVLILAIPLIVSAGGKWYEGGTLHRSNVGEWNRSTYANKLATAADMALASKRIKAKVQRSGSVETLKPFAEVLVTCVDNAAAGTDYNTKVTELAAGCVILMGWQ